MKKETPKGYMRDASDRLVPIELVSDIDKMRDDLVKELVNQAHCTQRTLKEFKGRAMDDIAAFVELSAEKYQIKMGGQKGNITLLSFDGRYKIQRAISESITFDERLQVAKELIDTCIHRWTAGSNSEVRALIEHAFQANKEGNISTGRILSLMKLEIKDPDWINAMSAIKDSIQISGSKSYLRLYERIDNTDAYKPIALDVAAL